MEALQADAFLGRRAQPFQPAQSLEQGFGDVSGGAVGKLDDARACDQSGERHFHAVEIDHAGKFEPILPRSLAGSLEDTGTSLPAIHAAALPHLPFDLQKAGQGVKRQLAQRGRIDDPPLAATRDGLHLGVAQHVFELVAQCVLG